MLVLSRKVGERVVIRGVGTVTVLRCSSEQTVRLGFDMPKAFDIYREELETDANPEAEGTPVPSQ